MRPLPSLQATTFADLMSRLPMVNQEYLCGCTREKELRGYDRAALLTRKIYLLGRRWETGGRGASWQIIREMRVAWLLKISSCQSLKIFYHA
jgi:hypothetical protein